MGQEESRLQQQSSKRASVSRSDSVLSHNRFRSMVQSAPIRPKSPTPTQAPPAYSVQDPSPTQATHSTNPFINPPLSINTSGRPQVPPVTHRRQQTQSLASPPQGASGSSHVRRATTIGQTMPQHNGHHPTNPTPLVNRTGFGSNRRTDSTPTRPAQPPATVPPPAMASRRSSLPEDPLLQLVKYDTVIIVDDSSSMEGALWFEAREALAGVAGMAAKYDADGIDICFLNSEETGKGFSAAEVNRLFDRVQPNGITPTGERLEFLLLDYLLRLEHAKAEAEAGRPAALKEIKPVNFLVITDGAPTDDPETVIVTAARRLDAGRFPINQVGIQFIQIGSDPDASEALRELDDDLAGKYGIRDIVDTTLYTGNQLDAKTITKILLGGINRRVDRRGT